MEPKVLGTFQLKTFDGSVYEFIVKDNGLMFCDTITSYPLYRIIIKPIFELFGYDENGNKRAIFIRRKNNEYIEKVVINDYLFDYLRNNNMIKYSTDMAYLYNLKDKDGYDRDFQRKPFKHVKDKQKVLIKQKSGFYN